MKYIAIILFFILSLFTSQLINAVPAAPSPICGIKADVLNIEKTQKESFGYNTEYYSVSLIIKDVTTITQEKVTCDMLYKKDSQINSILTLEDYDKTPISIGQIIKTDIHFGGDERFNGNFLSNIQILEETIIPPKEITKQNESKEQNDSIKDDNKKQNDTTKSNDKEQKKDTMENKFINRPNSSYYFFLIIIMIVVFIIYILDNSKKKRFN